MIKCNLIEWILWYKEDDGDMESIRNIRCVYVCGCVIAAIAETKIFIFFKSTL